MTVSSLTVTWTGSGTGAAGRTVLAHALPDSGARSAVRPSPARADSVTGEPAGRLAAIPGNGGPR